MELAFGRDETNFRLLAVERVISGRAHDEVVRCRCKTVLVEESRDARGGHAAPGVCIGVEQARDDTDSSVSLGGGGQRGRGIF